jgi:oxysterol-binding protein-related protein 3/6/7
VSHNPPVMACHVQGCIRDGIPLYEFWQDFRVKSKFWGKSIEFTPYGNCYLKFLNSGELFTWKKVISAIHNVIGGTPWAEHYGELKVTNHLTKEHCLLNFRQEKGLFSQSSDNEVTGFVHDANGVEVFALKGNWHERLFVLGPPAEKNLHGHPEYANSLASLKISSSKKQEKHASSKAVSQLIWQHKAMPEDFKMNYGFNEFTLSLNDLLPSIEGLLPPTDTRFRPDQRMYEEGMAEQADIEKARLEELQRERRRLMDTDNNPWKPAWFTKVRDPMTQEDAWIYNGKYWDSRNSGTLNVSSCHLW